MIRIRIARLKRLMVVGGLALAAILQGSAARAAFDGPLAVTDKGLLRGTSTVSMHAFRGIPYAAPRAGVASGMPPVSRATARSPHHRSASRARSKTASI